MKKIVRLTKNTAHKSGAMAANIYYGFPGRRLRVIGVTGTDGKTTTCHLIYHILKNAGRAVSLTSSIYTDIGGVISDTGLHVTTQNHWLLQKNLQAAVKAGCEFFVLETTSHALDQHRIWGINYEVGVLTNITPEHLDYHKNFDEYVATKVKLLLKAQHAIVNKDADVFEKVCEILTKNNKQFTTYSIRTDADFIWDARIKTSLKEDFNYENIIAAYAACKKLGLSDEDVLKGIRTFQLPKGRVDKVYSGDFHVYIDFAHTPHSIRNLLSELKRKKGRLIHVFGSAGLRDEKKRPDMGRASGEYADVVVITEEDYRAEDFMKISQSISGGLYECGFTYAEPDILMKQKEATKIFTIIKNREKAIMFGVKYALRGDTVVCTGKSHEKSLARGDKEYPWDEYVSVMEALRKYKKKK
ncbi:hypothetical protein A3D08_00545 [Candidatus Roizmanbacteria bacterium RIFCSPHIGHO2_02_FULL_43_11]|uniref:UDP-N-acetylmuramoyl-L-alanyl-D-glutamate--2, 6-diaminopimelate ligase n=1 Tax=Candidatus Roizmanbacteria bacterium RIFCSPHIGHO2_02_FULL_43_11 TaxID=1802043 RepID=A0A1F7HKT6_9BACT|nr:MAG: hypothetical protein A3D08_00545 [Candidatus Roizmanbacteria bacterium RIFCSPHIGHO2_02_FULL_43_11]